MKPPDHGFGRALLAITLVLGAACDHERPVPDVVVRDSAHVSIVESFGPAWAADREWRLSSEPAVHIGVLDGPDEYRFFRAASAVRLDDGRIVVANGGTGELRFFDAPGHHVRSVGRIGDGPGEFRDLQWVWRLPGDTLLAYDFSPGRLSLFDSEGHYVSSFQVLSPDGRQVFVLGPLDGGALLVQGAPVWTGPGVTEGVFQDSVPIWVYSRQGEVVGRLGLFPFTESFRVRTERGWSRTSPPFPRSPVRTAARGGFIFGPAEEYELRVYGLSGELRRVIRLMQPRRPVTSHDVEAFRRRRLEAAQQGGLGEATARLLRNLPVPEFMPPYERVLTDRSGHIWVADHRAAGDEPRTWKVFDPEGGYLGEVEFPRAFEALDIGDDYVLGRVVDELDVEYIRLYDLHRAGRASP